MEIKKEKLEKTTQFLNDMRILCSRNNGFIESKDRQKVHNKYSLPYSYFKIARELKYFTQVGDKQFICSKQTFDPIHARHLIVKHNEYHRLANIEWKQRKAKKELSKIEFKPVQKPKTTKVKNMVIVEKKTFSLFWGLVKFNY